MKDSFLYLSSMLILLSANDHQNRRIPGNPTAEAGIIAPAFSKTVNTFPLTTNIPLSYKQYIDRVIHNLAIGASIAYPGTANHCIFLYARYGNIRGENSIVV